VVAGRFADDDRSGGRLSAWRQTQDLSLYQIAQRTIAIGLNVPGLILFRLKVDWPAGNCRGRIEDGDESVVEIAIRSCPVIPCLKRYTLNQHQQQKPAHRRPPLHRQQKERE